MKPYQVFFRMERRGIFSWAAGAGLLLLLFGIIYGVFGQEQFDELLEAYPPELLEAFPDISSINGFIKAEAGSFLPLVFGLYLVFLMTKHFAGAEEGGRLDHVMARPITRTTYYWNTLLGGAMGYAIIVAAMTLGALAGFAAVASPRELLGIVGLMFEYFILGLPFLALGGLLGSAFHRRGPANGVGAGIVVFFFAVDFAGRLIDGAPWLAYLSPMGFQARSNLFDGEPSLLYFTIVPGFSLLAALAGWLVFRRKNLYA